MTNIVSVVVLANFHRHLLLRVRHVLHRERGASVEANTAPERR